MVGTRPAHGAQTADFKLARSLRKTVQRFANTPGCEIRIDHDRAAVLKACAGAPREGQSGTWIVPELQAAYLAWPAMHSIETWMDGELTGGLYGVNLGHMFYGESMFMRRTDASKIALCALICLCREFDIPWIDCQQNTPTWRPSGRKKCHETCSKTIWPPMWAAPHPGLGPIIRTTGIRLQILT